METQLKLNIEQKISSKLDPIISFLTINFFKEHPDSFFPEEASIEEGVICNSSYCQLFYDIGEKEFYTRLCGTYEEEMHSLKIYHGGRYSYPGELVYYSVNFHGDSPDKIDVYIPGEWEEIILREFERRKNLD